VATCPDLSSFPLVDYFLRGYLSKVEDPDNFPVDEFPDLFQRYENIFALALQALGLTKEALKKRAEFNFDSGDAANLEGGMGILRVVEALRIWGFLNIALVKPTKDAANADLTSEKNGYKVCWEVKTITKQSSGKPGRYLEDQVYEKVVDSIPRARIQLETTAATLQCNVKIFVCVLNWLAHSMQLDQDGFQYVTNRLERHHDLESLKGIDGVLFVTKRGPRFLFLNEHGKCIDS
jgi:hypothetical protein